MGDCGIIFLTYLCDSVLNSCKVIKGNNKEAQDIFYLGTSLMYDRVVIHGVLIYMYII